MLNDREALAKINAERIRAEIEALREELKLEYQKQLEAAKEAMKNVMSTNKFN